jgi:hypothetical protein
VAAPPLKRYVTAGELVELLGKLARKDAAAMSTIEPWVDKKGLAAHLACSVRSIELAIVEGLPHAIIFGRVKFHASEAEAWLERTGRLQRRGEPADTVPDSSGPAVREHHRA